MDNLIVIAVVVLIIGAALRYIYKAKKRGIKCIGCPDGCHCAAKNETSCGGCCSGCSGCSSQTKQ